MIIKRIKEILANTLVGLLIAVFLFLLCLFSDVLDGLFIYLSIIFVILGIVHIKMVLEKRQKKNLSE